jgi:predicted outer membrane protein
MNRIHLLTFCAVTVLAGASIRAQAPAPGATPAPAAPAPAPGATPAPAPGAAPAGEVKKPYSPADIRTVTQAAEILQFHMQMGRKASQAGKDRDKDLAAIGTRIEKEAKDYNTALLNMAKEHQVPDKDVPMDVSKNDKAEMDKLGKVKEDKWKLEFYDMFSKQAKKNARFFDGASRSAADPDLKDLAGKAARIIEGHADSLEKAYKDLKNPKKEAKK